MTSATGGESDGEKALALVGIAGAVIVPLTVVKISADYWWVFLLGIGAFVLWDDFRKDKNEEE